MTKLKCWKKIAEHPSLWKRGLKTSLVVAGNFDRGYAIYGVGIKRTFKSESQAIKYAKKYMKKHDKC